MSHKHIKDKSIGEHSHFLSSEMFEKHKTDFIDIYEGITSVLSKYPNFSGIDFCDVSANGIQIRLHHKDISGYSYGGQVTIKYDFSNKEEAIKDAIRVWEDYDTPEHLKFEKHFLSWGNKYGWD